MKTLLVSGETARLANLENTLVENEARVTRVRTGSEGMSEIAARSYDLVVADEQLPDMTGLELVRKVVLTHPMVNIAVVSSLSSDDFHEISEGLGILMQLSPDPGHEEAETLVNHLNSILKMTRSGV